MLVGQRCLADFLRRSLLALSALLPVLVLLSFSTPAQAYPFMIRDGFAKCGSCHTDPMGGETLTGFGRAMSETLLSTRYTDKEEPTNASLLLFGIEEPEWLRFGGSYRHMNIYQFPKDGQDGDFASFPMQMDVYGQARAGKVRVAGSLGFAQVPSGSPHARPAQITSGSGDRDLNLISRSHWIGYDVSDHILVRAGRINLPFGIRLPEHVLWAREQTRTDRESDQQHGIALSYSEGRIRGELMAIAGNYQIRPDEYRERGYSFHSEYLFSPGVALGVSSLLTHAASDRILTTPDGYLRQAHGLTGRIVPFRELVLLAEADLLFSNQTSAGYVGLLQADYELFQGFHVMGTGEFYDAGQIDGLEAISGAGEPRVGGWLSLNWFFFTHFDARVDLVARQGAPLSLQSQLHFYF